MKKIYFILIILLFVTGCEKEIRSGIEKYDKNYYINTYGGSLDSNLAIFPDENNLINAKFLSSFENGLFDSYGYIILSVKYDLEEYSREIERLKAINITIKETCYSNSNEHTNYIKYDLSSYPYPAYIAIDGFASTYEYALLNEKDLEIIYVYISYPDIENTDYKEYLKNNKKEYSKSLDSFSIYNHSFDNGKSFMEFDDC